MASGETGEPVYVRLTPSERAEIERAASAFGISPAEFMRRRALGYRLPANTADRQATASLASAFNRLGVNMNQIARHLNVGRDPSEVEADLAALIGRVNIELDRIYGPGSNGGGRSFKGAALYYLHDKRREGEAERLTADRLAWSSTVNLSTDDPDRAWRIMADTAMSQAELKRQAGEKATGRKLTKPVYAYSLSWHPDEKITRDEQLQAALASLKAQGLDGYQALIMAHSDEPQAHVHILVNRVHPETGIAAKLSKNYEQLSAWALGYQRERGQDYCPAREENAKKRQKGEKPRAPRKPRPVYEAEKIIGNDSLTGDFVRSNEKQKDAQLYAVHRSMKDSHSRQWDALKQTYATTRTKAIDYGRKLKSDRATEIKEQYKFHWKNLFAAQRIERQALGRREDSLLSRLFNGLSMLSEIRQNHEGRLAILFALMTRKGHMDALDTRHENERKALAKGIGEVIRESDKMIDKAVAGDLDRLRTAYLNQCGGLKATQEKQQGEMKAAWSRRNADRKAALAPTAATAPPGGAKRPASAQNRKSRGRALAATTGASPSRQTRRSRIKRRAC